MLKVTWKGHADTQLPLAYQKISDIAIEIEAAQERYLNMTKIISIQSEIKSSKQFNIKLLQPHRYFLYKLNLDLQELTSQGHVIRKGRVIIIFNDLIVITKQICLDNENRKRKRKENLAITNLIYLSQIITLHPVVFGFFFFFLFFSYLIIFSFFFFLFFY